MADLIFYRQGLGLGCQDIDLGFWANDDDFRVSVRVILKASVNHVRRFLVGLLDGPYCDSAYHRNLRRNLDGAAVN